jgi:hypothetical protein
MVCGHYGAWELTVTETKERGDGGDPDQLQKVMAEGQRWLGNREQWPAVVEAPRGDE